MPAPRAAADWKAELRSARMLRAGAPTAGSFRTEEVHTGVMGLGVTVSGWGDQGLLKLWEVN